MSKSLIDSGIDIIDGTPLIDIKPYVPNFSPKEKVKIGWLKEKIKYKKSNFNKKQK